MTSKPRLSELAWVFFGGCIGTASRWTMSLLIPNVSGVPVAIFCINVLAAFALGWLLTALSAQGPDHGARRKLRLFMGTGFLGGFSTYSALATDGMLLLTADSALAGLGYVLATVVIGALATWCGMLLGVTRRPQKKEG